MTGDAFLLLVVAGTALLVLTTGQTAESGKLFK